MPIVDCGIPHNRPLQSTIGQERGSEVLARRARAHALRMVHRAKASHIGAALSMIDILAVLYADAMRVRPEEPDWPERDRLIVSKGHGAVGLYAVLGELGFFPPAEFETYGADGARLMGHVSHHVPGVELSTGSLGHGLPVACGLALGLPASRDVFCVLGRRRARTRARTGRPRCSPPTTGSATSTAIVDHNGIQSLGRVEDVLSLGSIAAKFFAFGWRTVEVDGHDHDALRDRLRRARRGAALRRRRPPSRARASTSWRTALAWHYRSPDDAQLARRFGSGGEPVGA